VVSGRVLIFFIAVLNCICCTKQQILLYQIKVDIKIWFGNLLSLVYFKFFIFGTRIPKSN